ncbi:Gfo/Idh/MocA family protein [Nocardia jinanensis]|uniref:Oxidoreductase n=1 Tax=Nocardia jinanensis TaxID=382504 RepID=A0A917RCU1_9NOCA|nr:Gfo/Idh/MocA family oxidoreductase [Nocardia jinanensis]GGL00103.1 oxidoreductase [Nocardia jinanensis]
MSSLGVAIIGYGLAGSVFHAPLVAAEPRLRVAAVVTGSAERAEQARREHPGVRVLPDADSLFADMSGIDLVVVAAPNRVHAELARRALEAGAAVVVDKPFAVTAAEAEDLLRCAQATGRILTVFQNRRWDGDFRTVRKLMADGALGSVHRFESRFERWRPVPKGGWREVGGPADAAGILYDLGSHLVDQALTLFGPVETVYCELAHRRPGVTTDDDMFLALTHTGGVHSHLWASAVAPLLGPRFRVLGDRAGYEVHGLDLQEAALRAGHRPGGGEPWGVAAEADHGVLGAGSESASYPTLPGDYPAFYTATAAAVLDGAPVPVDPAEALAGLRVLEAARESAAERTRVAIGAAGPGSD